MEDRFCDICGQQYIPNRHNQRCCSIDCQKVVARRAMRKKCENPAYVEKRRAYYRKYYETEAGMKCVIRNSYRRIIDYCRAAKLSPQTTNAMVLDGETLNHRLTEFGIKFDKGNANNNR